MKKILSITLAVALSITLALPASAANFTQSVQGKEAPDVVPVSTGTTGNVAAEIRNAEGVVVAEVPVDALIVTPVSQRDNADTDIGTALDQAYQQINSVDTLDELTSDIIPALETMSSEITVADLVVRDLFDVTVRDENETYLNTAGNSITIRFALDLNPDALLMVLHNYSGSEWEVIQNDQVVRHENGDVSVTFNSLSPVAFVVDGGEVEIDPNAPTSPQTGVSTFSMMLVCAAGLACAAVFFFIMGKKRTR